MAGAPERSAERRLIARFPGSRCHLLVRWFLSRSMRGERVRTVGRLWESLRVERVEPDDEGLTRGQAQDS
jgi:hypothetical protein